MSYCPQCGFKIGDTDKFCTNCGTGIIKTNKPIVNDRESRIVEDSGKKQAITSTKVVENQKINGESKVDSKKIGYFYVSEQKLMVLSITTFGLYEFYWFYRNWKEIKDQNGEKISPILRAWFSPIFSYGLFKRILSSAKEQGYMKSYSPGLLVIIYFLFVVSGSLPDLLWIISFASFMPLIMVQEAINFTNEKTNSLAYRKGQGFSSGETLLAIIGIIIVLFSIIGSMDS